ncbi:Uncharacterised protein [Yersinia wautersii]|uniref:Uncharacterized protein n=2 Tax=Yersinia pseudotuberculosis complex TaxID=1649845 RepID=A0A380QEM6_YERPU|nr:Uncharacterised protein [Yersinia wautersii]SUP86973.1 Uncharacterised protein [Yersinia pseudotuberculosis]
MVKQVVAANAGMTNRFIANTTSLYVVVLNVYHYRLLATALIAKRVNSKTEVESSILRSDRLHAILDFSLCSRRRCKEVQ